MLYKLLFIAHVTVKALLKSYNVVQNEIHTSVTKVHAHRIYINKYSRPVWHIVNKVACIHT